MKRPVVLFTNGWQDLPLEEVAAKAATWGYDGFELTCEFLDVREMNPEAKLDALHRHDLKLAVLSNHKVGQAVCDPIDERHKPLLPERVWGDGKPDGVRKRAAEEMIGTVEAAAKLGVGVVGGFTGSPLWSYVAGYPAASAETVKKGFRDFAKAWTPIVDACRDHGVKYAFEVHPGQIAYDLYSAEATLDALHGREEFGFTFDPSHLFWQGVEPVEFLRAFPNRIYHVHIKDCSLTLNGRSGILNGYLPSGDPRRGFQFRTPGRGSIDWEAILRGLGDIKYTGSLAVDFHDRGVNREWGAAEACRFLKSLEFEGP